MTAMDMGTSQAMASPAEGDARIQDSAQTPVDGRRRGNKAKHRAVPGSQGPVRPWRRIWHRATEVMYRIGLVISVALLLATAVWAWRLVNVGDNERNGSVITERVSTQELIDPAGAATASPQDDSQASQTGQANGSAGRSAVRDGQYGSQPYRASASWLQTTSADTGIPVRALAAYAAAQLRLAAEQPSCGLGWNTIAAIGAVESGHGTHGGSQLAADGTTTTNILGPVLSGGNGFAAIQDTDGGSGDGSSDWDRAQGPMQFIPSTWATWGSDNSGDGRADVNQIDDAAWSAARYLCHVGSVGTAEQWRAAVYSYNHSDEYVNQIASVANQYATAVK